MQITFFICQTTNPLDNIDNNTHPKYDKKPYFSSSSSLSTDTSVSISVSYTSPCPPPSLTNPAKMPFISFLTASFTYPCCTLDLNVGIETDVNTDADTVCPVPVPARILVPVPVPAPSLSSPKSSTSSYGTPHSARAFPLVRHPNTQCAPENDKNHIEQAKHKHCVLRTVVWWWCLRVLGVRM